jgi:hypothetical protein
LADGSYWHKADIDQPALAKLDLPACGLIMRRRHPLLAPLARPTMRTTSDMTRFNSKSFGLCPLSWQQRTPRLINI